MSKISILCCKLLGTIFISISSILAIVPRDAKIYVAGHRGLVGSAIIQELKLHGYTNIVTRTSKELDLRDRLAVEVFFQSERPEYVYFAAAKVGGIQANIKQPAEFIYDNTAIEINVIHTAYISGVKKLLFLGSSCIYPRLAAQPMKEEYLLGGPLEPTNEGYALAKILGIKMCQAYNKQYGTNFITCMPTNLYGPRDDFSVETGHALPALIAKMHKAKIEGADHVPIWGTGSARREWLHVDDLAQACIYLMDTYSGNDIINIGMGQDISMRDLAYMIKEAVGFQGELRFDVTKPEGMPQKLLNVDKATGLGWLARINLRDGIEQTYAWYLESLQDF